MKKLLPTLVLLLVLGTGGAAVYLFQKGHGEGEASENIAAILPAGTQAMLSVPDVEGTLADWRTTDLYKIWTEPEVQDFLARPLSKLPAHPDFDETVARIVRLSPTNVFLALTSFDEQKNEPYVVAGFDFKGDKADVEALLAGAKDGFRKQFPGGKADLIEYQGHALETFDDGDGHVVASTYLDHRYLVADDVALLKATLDRIDHRAPSSEAIGTLDKETDFQTVLSKLPVHHATLAFLRPQFALHHLLDLLTASGQNVDDAKRAELAKLKAIGATTAIENGKLRDTLYCLAPGMKLDAAKLQMDSLALTSPATLLYAAATFNLPTQLNVPPGPPPPGTPVSGLLTGLQGLAASLQSHGLTLDRVRAAFGNELSLAVNWPANRSQPAVLATLNVRDAAAAGKVVDDLTNAPTGAATWQTSLENGLKLHTLTAANLSYVSPTLTLTSKHLIFGLDPGEVRRTAQREQAGGANLTGGEAYKSTIGMVAAPNASFVYLDSPALFERVYGTVRGVALLGAALLYPQLGDYVDLAKLPNAQAVSKHLSPTVFSQKSDEQGSLAESVGSFTLGQAAIVVVGGASAAAIPLAQSQFGAAMPDMQSAPAATPRAVVKPGSAPVSPTP